MSEVWEKYGILLSLYLREAIRQLQQGTPVVHLFRTGLYVGSTGRSTSVIFTSKVLSAVKEDNFPYFLWKEFENRSSTTDEKYETA